MFLLSKQCLVLWGSCLHLFGVVLVIGIPHLAVGEDITRGGLLVQRPVMAAEGFEEGLALWQAGVA
ncbi:hypothetical protein AFE_2379 [Acidithiobacillus ferrooxidans ATCC 23270]|uniref:Uncharacterized protein n=1 Tax=Acidithiobacillus ferrooxidans (strain ATCC 23270 / DSM 14882 / CIP 104768 / NCIMB 8455) TaxID=243159 RepID=B7J6E3_ACIF2|nr:hypothetical protein AFE_2379 [Acidithiobacillus ferrooxidans ATCC 23270]